MSETEPDTTNVFYLDETRKARWLRQLDDARKVGGIATFNFEYDEPADVIPFPTPDDTPDGAA